MKPNLISGIQPSGPLHLGNYVGALKQFVALQDAGQYQCFFFIADLHSLTEEFSPAEKKQQLFDLLASYLAAGLKPSQSTLFIQSQVPAHSQLAWILNTLTPFGELGRMTQFKDKSEHQPEQINVGLFDYPVLMAADVLLYDAQCVPVGDDQVQHLEFTRFLARRFNHRFGETFVEPQPLVTTTPRVMSLHDPTKKMSKSQPAGCLFLDDPPEEISRKIMAAVTDSEKEIRYDRAAKPGIANLLAIFAAFSNRTIAHLEEEFRGQNYTRFKKSLIRLISRSLAPFRKKKARLLTNQIKLLRVISRGTKAAQAVAEKKLIVVKQRLGLLE